MDAHASAKRETSACRSAIYCTRSVRGLILCREFNAHGLVFSAAKIGKPWDTIDRPLLWASYVRHISISSSRVRGLEGGLCKRPIGFQLNTRSDFYFHPRLHGSVGSVVIYKVIDAWKSNSKFLVYLYHMLCFWELVLQNRIKNNAGDKNYGMPRYPSSCRLSS